MQNAAFPRPAMVDGRFPFGSLSCVRHLTDDPYRHARNLTGWRREVVQLSAGGFSGKVAEVGGGGLYVADETISRSMFHVGPAYAGGVTLGVVQASEGKPAIWNGLKVSGDTVLCVFDGAEMAFRSHENSRVQWLFVPWKILGGQSEISACVSRQRESAALRLVDDRLAARLGACVTGLCRLSESMGAECRLSAEMLVAAQEEIVGIVRTFMRDYLVTIPGLGVREAHAMRILRAVREYLRKNVGESIGIPDLCDAASTSERTIRNACEIVTGESPIAFLRAMRLNQVRRCLLNATNPVRITEISMRWGFLHMPQFSKDYRSLFGELPSETIRRQLAAPGFAS